MIKISGSISDTNTIIEKYPKNSIQRKIIEILSSSSEVYNYDSLEQLKFELDLRKKIIDSARELKKSKFSFKTFRKSKCNEEYWQRTDEGGFLLKKGVKPFDAVNDIYINSSKYATECATAIVIVYYKALADMFTEELFNSLFPNIYLMDWQHLDSNMGINLYRKVVDFLPGDCRYFKNPDVDPTKPEWQGENAIDFGDGSYYGHGIGIRTADEIIKDLNKHRKKEANTSAFLMDTANRPDFRYLANRYYSAS